MNIGIAILGFIIFVGFIVNLIFSNQREDELKERINHLARQRVTFIRLNYWLLNAILDKKLLVSSKEDILNDLQKDINSSFLDKANGNVNKYEYALSLICKKIDSFERI